MRLEYPKTGGRRATPYSHRLSDVREFFVKQNMAMVCEANKDATTHQGYDPAC